MENEGKPETVTNAVAGDVNNGGQTNYAAPPPGYGAAQPGPMYAPNQPTYYDPNLPAPAYYDPNQPAYYDPNQPAYYDPNQPAPMYDPNVQMMAPPVGTYPGAPGYMPPPMSPYGGMQPAYVAPKKRMARSKLKDPARVAARKVAWAKSSTMIKCPQCHEDSFTKVKCGTSPNQFNKMILL